MEKLTEIVSKAIADYGFRQVALWSPEDVVARWELSVQEADVLKGPLREELARLPNPVEPSNIPQEQQRFARLIDQAMKG